MCPKKLEILAITVFGPRLSIFVLFKKNNFHFTVESPYLATHSFNYFYTFVRPALKFLSPGANLRSVLHRAEGRALVLRDSCPRKQSPRKARSCSPSPQTYQGEAM